MTDLLATAEKLKHGRTTMIRNNEMKEKVISAFEKHEKIVVTMPSVNGLQKSFIKGSGFQIHKIELLGWTGYYAGGLLQHEDGDIVPETFAPKK